MPVVLLEALSNLREIIHTQELSSHLAARRNGDIAVIHSFVHLSVLYPACVCLCLDGMSAIFKIALDLEIACIGEDRDFLANRRTSEIFQRKRVDCAILSCDEVEDFDCFGIPAFTQQTAYENPSKTGMFS